jgi:hypothetical protein
MDLQSKNKSGRKPDRLGLKLIIIFGVSVASTVGVLFAIGLFSDSLFAKKNTSPRIVAPTSVDPKLESDLVAALEYDEVPEAERFTDPFVDRQNLAREVAGQQGSANQPLEPFIPPSAMVGGEAPGSDMSRRTGAVDYSRQTKERWDRRQEQLKAGRPAGPQSEIFSVYDLAPVSSFRFGSEQPEINFFSSALNQRVRFKVGTRFFDGTLIDVVAGGVRFRLNSGEIQFVGWKPEDPPQPKNSGRQSTRNVPSGEVEPGEVEDERLP